MKRLSYKTNKCLIVGVPTLATLALITTLVVKVTDAFASRPSTSSHNNSSLRRVIADVDPGIDDIEALVFLIDADNRGLLRLEAIIVTEGNTGYKYGVRNVFLLLEATNRKEIPVYLGAKRPILEHDTPMGGYYGVDGVGDLEWKTKAPVELLQQEKAYDAIRRLAHAYPHQITYMTMAPLSSLGLTILLYPEVAALLKDIHSMGGFYTDNEGEFNVKFDAEAADIVLRALRTKMVLVTFKAGEINSPNSDWYKNVTNVTNPVWQFMVRIQDAIIEKFEYAKWEHCDPIVPAVYLNPGLVSAQFSSGLEVEVGRSASRGIITNSSSSAIVDVVMQIDYPRMLQDFVGVFASVCSGERKCVTVD